MHGWTSDAHDQLTDGWDYIAQNRPLYVMRPEGMSDLIPKGKQKSYWSCCFWKGENLDTMTQVRIHISIFTISCNTQLFDTKQSVQEYASNPRRKDEMT